MKAFRAGAALACALLFAAPAIAQLIPEGAYRSDGVRVPIGAYVLISKDTVSGLPCVAGYTPTCPGGGGGSTAALLPWSPDVGGETGLAPTAATSRIQLPATAGDTIFVQNTGPTVDYINRGNSAVTAALTDFPVLPGQCRRLAVGTATHLAAITPGGTGSLLISRGTGDPGFCLAVDMSLRTSVIDGGLAKTSDPTAVSDGANVDALHDVFGKRVVIPALRNQKFKQLTTITGSAAETTIVTAAAANVFADVYGLILSNTSGSDGVCTFKDATAGSTVTVIAVKAGQTSGLTFDAGSAIPQAVAANNWTATCTSLSSWNILALYVKTKG